MLEANARMGWEQIFIIRKNGAIVAYIKGNVRYDILTDMSEAHTLQFIGLVCRVSEQQRKAAH